MHGLVFCTVQAFVQDAYGAAHWDQVREVAGIKPPGFAPMFHYPDTQLPQLLAATAQVLAKPQEAVLEDVGIYLMSHPKRENLRRLLRFGGTDFTEFLFSLEELADRTRLAVFDLDLPRISLVDQGEGAYEVTIAPGLMGFGYVLEGVIQAIADDYGALILMTHDAQQSGGERLCVQVIQSEYAQGRDFTLGGGPRVAAQ